MLKKAPPPSRPRGLHEGRRRLLPGLPARPARPHRQPRRRQRSCRRRRWCASTATTPTSWSPPTRAPRPSPTTPTPISKEYGHWLGDAFASGGSVGYDHKAMGITARGAWESVKRHFREHGRRHADAPTSPWSASATCRATCSATACCCRGTSGWWRPSTTGTSSSTRSPTPAASFAERERLFKLPRSSWADYDTKLISDGGGVWARSEKSIPISPQARAALGIEAERLTPDRAGERDPEGAGRPALQRRHRHLREGRARRRTPTSATAPTTRCASTAASCAARWSAEGGNLGFTQRGRIEAALGGRAHQHRRDRQLGRRRHLGPRGQHQDPARPRRSATARSTEKQRNALLRADDRRRRGAGAARQLLPDAGAVGRRAPRRRAARRSRRASSASSRRPGA